MKINYTIILKAFIILFSAALSWGCGESYRTILENNRESGETVRLYKFVRQSVNQKGKTEWIMNAEEAYIFREKDQESKIIAYNFIFHQYNIRTGKLLTNLNAGRGEIDYLNQKVYLNENVTFKESDTRHGIGTSMEYDMETKIISSNQEVVIYDGGTKTVCTKGIEIDRENKREVCKGPSAIHRQAEGSHQNYNDLFD